MTDYQLSQLSSNVKLWGKELGFQQIGITDTQLGPHKHYLKRWLNEGYHGDMLWMEDHGNKRFEPDELLPGTQRVISARMDYLPGNSNHIATLKDPDKAYISRYALGRDYHKLIRKRLSTLAKKLEQATPANSEVSQRAFVDSAPVMERALAEKSGLGWIGKNTLLINHSAGSWFFLGEIYTNIPLIVDQKPAKNQCGDCSACLKVCPTDAFTSPYRLDARRCISYLTIENKGAIPIEFRQAIGNRVFGCDDCQAICPWNKYAKPSSEKDFSPRHALDSTQLIDLFLWDENTFLQKTEGSAIRRIGYERWQRNLAIGIGNGSQSSKALKALHHKRTTASDLLAEHIDWAIEQLSHPNRKRLRKVRRADAN